MNSKKEEVSTSIERVDSDPEQFDDELKTFILSFDVNGIEFAQVVKIIDSDYSKEDILKGLSDKTLKTPVWFREGRGRCFIKDLNGSKVAKLLLQEVFIPDGVEFCNFKEE